MLYGRVIYFSETKGSELYFGQSMQFLRCCLFNSCTYTYAYVCVYIRFSINAVGVDIAPLSAMPKEQEVLLLPGLPLVNRPGVNPEPDLWAFEIETPDASADAGESPSVMIDYVHPGIS